MAGEDGTFIAYDYGVRMYAYTDDISAALLRFAVEGVRGFSSPMMVCAERSVEVCPGLVRLSGARIVPGVPAVPGFTLAERVALARLMAKEVDACAGSECGGYSVSEIDREYMAATAALRASEARRHQKQAEDFGGADGIRAAALASGAIIAWCLATGKRAREFNGV